MNNRKRTKGRNYKFVDGIKAIKDKDGNIVAKIKKVIKHFIPTRRQIESIAIQMALLEKIGVQRSKYTKKDNPHQKLEYMPLWDSSKKGTYVKSIHGDLTFDNLQTRLK